MDESQKVYLSLVSVCRSNYATSGDVGVCSLRSQLVMSIHDPVPAPQGGGGAAASAEAPLRACLADLDRASRIAVIMDACVKDGFCDAKRVQDVNVIIDSLKRDAEAVLRNVRARPRSSKQVLSDGEGSDSDGGQSISKSDDIGVMWLVDAGMMLRDPPVFHLLLHETVRPGSLPTPLVRERGVGSGKRSARELQVRTLTEGVEAGSVPKSNPHLCNLSKLLAVALGTKHQLLCQRRNRTLPNVSPNLLERFYPRLGESIMDALLRDEAEAGEANPGSLDRALVAHLGEPLALKVAGAYTVQRLAARDLASAAPILAAAAEALTDKALVDEVPFLVTLARRLGTLVSVGQLLPSSALWTVAVDKLLLRGTAVSVEVLEEARLAQVEYAHTHTCAFPGPPPHAFRAGASVSPVCREAHDSRGPGRSCGDYA